MEGITDRERVVRIVVPCQGPLKLQVSQAMDSDRSAVEKNRTCGKRPDSDFLETNMNLYDYALQMEQQSRDLYERLAHEASNRGLAGIFTFLAEEEAKHFRIVEEMKHRIPAKVAESTIMSNPGEVFMRLVGRTSWFDLNAEQLTIYKDAQAIENKNSEFYLNKAEEVTDACQKGILRILAAEEQKHALLLQHIIEFVSRPKQWLEYAEWYHLDEY
jgi:rubrerythrin